MAPQIITATPSDAGELADILWDCYGTTPMYRRMIKDPAAAPADFRTSMTSLYERTWADQERRLVKDTDSNKSMGFLSFSLVSAVEGESSAKVDNQALTEQVPASLDKSFVKELDACSHAHRAAIMGTKPFIYVGALNVRPEHQRRGIGKMLLDVVLAEADRRNLPVFLCATKEGKPLYEHNRFVVKAEDSFDMSSIDEQPYLMWAMLREAPQLGNSAALVELPRHSVKIVPMERTFEASLDYNNCSTKAFKSDPLIELCFNTIVERPSNEERAKKEMSFLENDDFIFHKAIDSQNPDAPVLGYSKWYIVRDPHAKVNPFGDYPPGANIPCLEATLTKLSKLRDEYFRSRNQPYMFMCALVVLPEAQRKGIGSSLLREGLKVADEKGWPCYIDASPAGLGLYKKLGWEEVEKVTINLKDFGGEDFVSTTVGLVRPPGAKEKKVEPEGVLPIALGA